MVNSKKSYKCKLKESQDDDLLDVFHPSTKLCTIYKTSQQTKPNVFTSFRPEPGTCLDYNISQTDAKLDGKGTKIHVQQTKALYDLVESDESPNQKKQLREKTCFCADKPPELLNLDSPQSSALPAPEESMYPKLMFLEPKNDKKKGKKTKRDENAEILDVFHPERKICSICKTTTTKKPIYFESFRPEIGTVLDYTISQTDTKMDAGPTKIHYQQTEAHYDWVPDYVAPPPSVDKPHSAKKKKKILNIEDIEKMRINAFEAANVAIRKEMKIRLKIQKKIDKIALSFGHGDALKRVGPEWFQELSPKQIKTVDDLEKAMLRDLQTNTYENTYENIKSLGVYLRPNHRYIQLALKECCKCPVEFLLILYQMIEPKRKGYSINDRLLLSAAAHLTIMETLRELHVRIPSPPRLKETAVQIKVNKQEKIQYESPYLEPFTFTPEPRKWNGVYRNKHVQRPESPYFAYLKKFREDLASAPVVTKVEISEDMPEVEKEILEELEAAQKVFESLVEFRPVPKLLKPSIYVPCVNFRLKKEKMLAEQKLKEVINQIQEPPAPDLGAVFDKLCRHCQQAYKDKIKEMEGSLDETTQTCAEETCNEACEETEQSEKEEAIEGANCDGREVSGSEANAANENFCGTREQEANEYPCGTCDADEVKEATPEAKKEVVKRPASRTERPTKDKDASEDAKACECKLEVQKVVDALQCSCERCIEDRKKKTPMIIAGLSEPPVDEGILPVIEGVYSPECSCLKKYQDAAQRFEDYQAKMKAIAELKRLQHKYIINGVVNTPNGPVFNIIGLRPQIDCVCGKNQRREEEENARLAAMPNAPPGRIKFGIIGTKETDAGNVYILSEALPIDDCDCMKLYNKYEDKHAACLKLWETYLKQMQGNIDDYMDDMGIDMNESESTSKEETEEDVKLEIKPKQCKCGAFIAKKHPCGGPLPCSAFPSTPPCMSPPCSPYPCMPPPCPPYPCTPPPCSPYPCTPPLCSPYPCTPPPCSPYPCTPSPCPPYPCTSPPCSPNPCTTLPCPAYPCTPPPCPPYPCMPTPCPPYPCTSPCLPNPCAPPSCQPFPCSFPACAGPCSPIPCTCRKPVDCKICDCGVQEVTEVVCEDCTCAPPPEPEPEPKPPKSPQFKRFVILDKIPCRRRIQLAVLKQALASMAEDDWPLAKLPDVHRLPHFKLWMQMRCGKYWTQEDRYRFIKKSMILWKHTDVCKRPIKNPELGMSKDTLSKLEWTQAFQVKKKINKIMYEYSRKVRQDMVNFGREFYPTLFTYEFPTPTFRDCFFAYTPSKEEEIINRFVWDVFEVKDFTGRQSCFCN